METSQKDAISTLFKVLCSNTTDTLLISNNLYTNNVLSSAEFDKIRDKASPYLKNEQLYETLLLTKSGNAMEYLLQALRETFNRDLVTRLEGEIALKNAPAVAQAEPVLLTPMDLEKTLRPMLHFLCEETCNIKQFALKLVSEEYITLSTLDEIVNHLTDHQRTYTLYKAIMQKNIPIEKLYDILTSTQNAGVVAHIKEQLALQDV